MKRGKTAFTLAEVMVAILFLSIAMFGYFALHLRIIHSSFTLSQRQNMRRHVEIAAAGVLYGDIPPKTGIFDLSSGLFTSGALYAQDPDDVYTGNVTVNAEINPPQLYRAEFDIRWANKHGAQNYVIDTYTDTKDPG